MKRSALALLSALDAIRVVVVGLVVLLLPLLVVWLFQFQLTLDFGILWRAAADIWLLAHGVAVQVQLDANTASALGLAGADQSFPISIMPLGITLITVILGVRQGKRAASFGRPLTSLIASVLVFAGLAVAITVTSAAPIAQPITWQGYVFPAIIFLAALLLGVVIEALGDTPAKTARELLRNWVSENVAGAMVSAVTTGLAITAAVIAAAAVCLTLAIVISYAAVIGLYQSLDADPLGEVMLTLTQLALLPNLVIWAASLLVGAGFAVGAGSLVSPAGTLLGPVPGVPVLGALPQIDPRFGWILILIPAAVSLICGFAIRRRFDREHRLAPGLAVGADFGAGVVAGALLGLAAWLSGGAAGPGRLADVGPDGFVVMLWTVAVAGVASALGGLLARTRSRD